MPRKSRIDAPGALHHIIARGIDRKVIFRDNYDRDDFLDRLGKNLEKSQTACYAWALLANHFHLLLKTGPLPISLVMKRVLTGYAACYNRRHRRHGHLFQNRFKSILCQEDLYLLELVRYIHLNPLRAGIVPDLQTLDSYPYCGHSRLTGSYEDNWQDAKYVLKFFGRTLGISQKRYREFAAEGIAKGRRPDLMGGGLIRSAGGWSAVKMLRTIGAYQKGDERLLGDNDFVEAVLGRAEETLNKPNLAHMAGFDLSKILDRVAELTGAKPAFILTGGRTRKIAVARCLACFWAVRELGMSQTDLSKVLHISQPAVSRAVIRGEKIAVESSFSLRRE